MKNRPAMQDMTQGSCMGHLVKFTLPLMLGSLLQQFYNLVDSWVVGNYVGDIALSAVGMGWPVMLMFTSLFTGISTGSTVMIAQFFGAGKTERVRDVVDSIYTAFTVSIIPMTIIALLLTDPLLYLMRVDAECFADAHLYTTIIATGIIGALGYNINAGILQGLGNSRTTLIFLGVATVLNVGLDLLFICVLGMGVEGVAIATIIAQFGSWISGLIYINKRYPEIAIHPFNRKFDKELFKKIVGIGLPHGLQMSMISIGVMLVYSEVNPYGASFSAGYNVGVKIDNLAFLPVQALSTAATTFTGQNMGAEKLDRVRKGTLSTLFLGWAWTIGVACLIVPLRHELAAIFSETQESVDAAALYIRCVLPYYVTFTTMFSLNAIMRGAGESIVPMLISLIGSIGVRVVAVKWLNILYGKEVMFYGFIIGYVVASLMAIAYYCSGRWKRRGSLVKND